MTTAPLTPRTPTVRWETAPLVPVLRRRRDALVESATGAEQSGGDPVVLTGPPAVWPPQAPRRSATVVTVGWLAAADDLDAALAELLDRLAPDGWVHVLEPTTGPPRLARRQRLVAAEGEAATGWRLGRDVPAALRRNGLVVTDLERFSMPTSAFALRPWVQARARRRAVRPVSTEGVGS